jgi:uncharacterized FlaG/YvyC family protein
LLAVDDLFLIFVGFIIALGLTLILYRQIAESEKPLPYLGDVKKEPNIDKLTESTNTLEEKYDVFKHKVNSFLLTSELGKDVNTGSEGKIGIILLFAFMGFMFLFVKYVPRENELFRGIGMFLSTFGIIVFLVSVAVYFKTVKELSDYIFRYRMKKAVSRRRKNMQHSLEFLKSYRKLNTIESADELIKDTEKKLIALESDMSQLESFVQSSKTSLKISIVPITGFVVSIITTQYDSIIKVEVGNWQSLAPLATSAIFLGFILISLFYLIPLTRERNLCRGFNMEKTEEDFTQATHELISSLLGEEVTEVVKDSLLYSG